MNSGYGAVPASVSRETAGTACGSYEGIRARCTSEASASGPPEALRPRCDRAVGGELHAGRRPTPPCELSTTPGRCADRGVEAGLVAAARAVQLRKRGVDAVAPDRVGDVLAVAAEGEAVGVAVVIRLRERRRVDDDDIAGGCRCAGDADGEPGGDGQGARSEQRGDTEEWVGQATHRLEGLPNVASRPSDPPLISLLLVRRSEASRAARLGPSAMLSILGADGWRASARRTGVWRGRVAAQAPRPRRSAGRPRSRRSGRPAAGCSRRRRGSARP